MDDAEPRTIDLRHRSGTLVRLRLRSQDRFLAGALSRALSTGDDFAALAPACDITDPTFEIAIDDCRRTFLNGRSDVRRRALGPSPPLALIHPTQANRQRVFRMGYADFIIWPIVTAEVRSRVRARCVVVGINRTRYRFTRDPLVEGCCRHMSQHLGTKTSVRELARSFGTNHNTLNDRFRRALEMTPVEWLRNMRMEAAARELVLTALPVSAIAGSVGYDRAENFATAFKRRYGISPREFRKVNEKQIFPDVSKDRQCLVSEYLPMAE